MNKIVMKRQLSAEVFELEVEAPLIAKERKAGQFVVLQLGDDFNERIPLTIADADVDKGTITLIVQAVGESTHRLVRLNEGEYIANLLGPLGRPTDIHKYGRVVIVGGGIGVFFWKQNFSLGQPRAYKNKLVGFLPLVISIILLILLLQHPKFSEGGPIFFSESGPGSMRAPIAVALIASIVIGFVAQKSRFCTVGGLRDGIFMKDFHMTKGVIAFIVAAFIVNIATSRFNLSMENQPIAHTNILWNTVSMILTGLAFTLGAGCPGRQVIQSAEGNMDSFIFVIGMLVGAGFAHNFNLASSTAGPTVYGMAAVVLGLVFCIIIGFTMKENTAS